jgi:uncharacterized protein YndB with AHSA1/START domain
MRIDILDHIGAAEREVRNSERDGRATRDVIAHRVYSTTVEDLWDAISNPDRIPRWFLPVSGELRPGGRYQLEGNAGGVIEACEPPRHLSVTWEFGGGVSWLTVRLSESGGGALLELEHVVPVDDHWNRYGPGATGVGWDLALMGLGEHLSQGAAIDREAALAWSVSEEGREFMRRSAEQWYHAAVAGGADEGEARARSARTTAAYTGEPEPDDAGLEGGG